MAAVIGGWDVLTFDLLGSEVTILQDFTGGCVPGCVWCAEESLAFLDCQMVRDLMNSLCQRNCCGDDGRIFSLVLQQ